MRWFGESWGAPVNESAEHAETPVGQKCQGCEEPIREADDGFLLPYLAPTMGDPVEEPWHFSCLMRSVLGSSWTGTPLRT